MRPLLGVALKVASAFTFTLMVTTVKLLDGRLPAGELVFARSLIGLVPVLLMVMWRREFATAFKTSLPFGHAVRALVGVSAMGLWFTALSMLPLPDATAISYAAPLLTIVLAAVLLGETVRIFRWTAVLIGFSGVMVILWPHLGGGGDLSDTAALGAVLAFGAACCMALAMILVRRLVATVGNTGHAGVAHR